LANNAWTNLKTGLTAGKRYSFATHQGILYGCNGTDANFKAYNTTSYQVGITPPAAAPSVAKTSQSYALNEDCDSFASPYTWTDLDGGSGASTTETEDAKTCFRFYNAAPGASELARRDTTLTTQLGTRFTFEIDIKLTTIGSVDTADLTDGDMFTLEIGNGSIVCVVALDESDIKTSNGTNWFAAGATITTGTWYTVRGVVDARDPTASTVDIYLDDVYVNTLDCSYARTGYPKLVTLRCRSESVATDVFVNNLTIENATGGRYKYKYVYKRSTDGGLPELIGNPSAVSDEIDLSSGAIEVSYVASSDAQVDKIIIYRTLDFSTTGDPIENYYKVVEVNNATSTYDDSTDDNDLTTLLEENNTVPPKAFFVTVHKDRVFYANCPDETDGDSIVMWSKSGEGENVPSSNYQYFDRSDGQDIAGMCSLTDYLLVFKEKKVGVLEGEFSSIYYLSDNIGCVAPWAIKVIGDKAIFPSEEGWMMCDGRNIYGISEKVDSLGERGYYSYTERANYFVALNLEKSQIHFMINHSALDKIVMVGHFISPLLSQYGEVPEEETSTAVSWTYHQYDNHTHVAMGEFTDASGLMRIGIIAKKGAADYFIYETESADGDESEAIAVAIQTGWSTMGAPNTLTKTVRVGHIGAAFGGTSGNEQVLTINTDVDFVNPVDTATITQVTNPSGSVGFPGDIYTGSYALHEENFKMNAVGRYLRWRLSESSIYRLTVMN